MKNEQIKIDDILKDTQEFLEDLEQVDNNSLTRKIQSLIKNIKIKK